MNGSPAARLAQRGQRPAVRRSPEPWIETVVTPSRAAREDPAVAFEPTPEIARTPPQLANPPAEREPHALPAALERSETADRWEAEPLPVREAPDGTVRRAIDETQERVAGPDAASLTAAAALDPEPATASSPRPHPPWAAATAWVRDDAAPGAVRENERVPVDARERPGPDVRSPAEPSPPAPVVHIGGINVITPPAPAPSDVLASVAARRRGESRHERPR